ncbi:hypothetical protein [Brevibacillus laterosporus]|uniref:hypothetical protein n=1 Tax=Brevibacillus laterosporus TaxID=1465 RepID=UPI0018CDFDF7|nr:hypothetical protein [Brevibacillus laterosporus]MBG9797710.1 hypothetical protein [Brevibacillus laterosporus]MED1909309.1 hypothetical protein [Brevibacillus laterosporus]
MVRRSKNKNPTKSRKKTWIKIGIKCWTFLKGEIGTLVVRTRTRVLGRSAYPLSTTYSKQSMDDDECLPNERGHSESERAGLRRL